MRPWFILPVIALSAAISSAGSEVAAVTPDDARCERGHDAEDCGRCHVAIHDEWSRSRHARAWTDAAFQAALRDLEHPERCHGCHAPRPVLARLGRPPRARAEAKHEGVTCVSCHDARGRVAGPFGAMTDAHESTEHPAFSASGSIHLCASCHDLRIGPVLPLARDFEGANLADRGKSCVRCHMPAVRRPIAVDPVTGAPSAETRRGRSHALRGPSDPEFCADAFKLAVRRDGDRVELAIGNRAGHRVPGLTTRTFTFTVVQRDAGGAELQQDRVTLSAENPILAAETRRFRVPRAADAREVVVIGVHGHGATAPVEFLRDAHALDL